MIRNKIDAIKAVRLFTQQVFGEAAGLKQSKELVDHLQMLPGAHDADQAFLLENSSDPIQLPDGHLLSASEDLCAFIKRRYGVTDSTLEDTYIGSIVHTLLGEIRAAQRKQREEAEFIKLKEDAMVIIRDFPFARLREFRDSVNKLISLRAEG